MDPTDLSDLLLSLYAGAREIPFEHFQAFALAAVKSVLSFDSAQWGSGPAGPGWVSKRIVHLQDESPEVLGAYEEIKDQDFAVQLLRAENRCQDVFSYNVNALLTGCARSGIRDYAHRFRHENVLMSARVDEAAGFARFVAFYRAKKEELYSEDDRRTARLLVPHLWQALTLNRAANLEQAGKGCGDQRASLAIADRDGWVHYAEKNFNDLLRCELGAAVQRLPDRCLSQLADAGRYVGGVATIVLQRTSGEMFFLRGRPSSAVDRLSRRELAVAKKFVTGLDYREIAATLFISPATVRNHLQAIYEKLAIHNKAELIARLASY
jgi:DNA-binding CsgD family transcriptional regulator